MLQEAEKSELENNDLFSYYKPLSKIESIGTSVTLLSALLFLNKEYSGVENCVKLNENQNHDSFNLMQLKKCIYYMLNFYSVYRNLGKVLTFDQIDPRGPWITL